MEILFSINLIGIKIMLKEGINLRKEYKMAKKFRKFLLFTAAVGTAAAAAYYYLNKKNIGEQEEEEDYDDFSEESNPSEETTNYVSLTPKTAEAKEDSFTPLAETAESVEAVNEQESTSVEEFFDEDDASDEEPQINY